MQIIAAETNSGHWMVWTSDAPQNGYGVPDLHTAVQRLLGVIGRSSAEFRLVPCDCTGKRVVLEELPCETCPDCAGTGRYVGFSVVEAWGACGGSGQA